MIACRAQVASTSVGRLHCLAGLTCLEIGYLSADLSVNGCVSLVLCVSQSEWSQRQRVNEEGTATAPRCFSGLSV